MATRTLKIVVALLAQLYASVGVAQQGDVFDSFFRYTGASPEASTGSDGTPADRLPGESIDPFTGNLRLERTDLVLPGRAGLDLRLTRVYSSKIWGRADLLDMEPLLAEKERSILGYGWSMHMGRLRGVNENDPLQCTASYPVFELSDGTSEVFYPAVDGDGFVSQAHSRLRLNCSFAGGGACIWTSNGIRYDFPGRYGDQFFMGTAPVWPVARIVDPSGNQIAVEYVPQTGAPQRITDTYQRVVDFLYSADVDGLRLDAFSVSDGRGNGKTYAYFYQRHSTAAASVGHLSLPGMRRFLVEAQPPAGPSEYYAYAYDATVSQNQYALSEVVLPAGGTVSYAYQAVPFFTGREMVPFAVVTERTLGGRGVPAGGTWTYEYWSPGYVVYTPEQIAAGLNTNYHVTVVHRPDGRRDTYTIYGFGWVASQNQNGFTYLAGRTREVARADRSEVETLWWDSGPSVISNGAYAAPAYSSGNCGPHYVWDWVVVSPVVLLREVSREEVNYFTQVESFDAYGRPLSTLEWANGQRAWVADGRPPIPPFVRHTSSTYFTAVEDSNGKPLNIVSGHPLSSTVTVGTDQTNATWTYDGDTGIRRTETVDGVTTWFQPDEHGDLVNVTDAAGHALDITDYEYGTPKTYDLGGAVVLTRDVTWEGRIHVQRDGRGNPTTYDYDDAGRLLRITPPGATVPTTYEYSPDGAWVRETRGAYFKQYDLDGLGRTVATLDSEGTRTSARYDARGTRWFASYPYSDIIGEVGSKTGFDGLGRPNEELTSYRPALEACTTAYCITQYNQYQNCVITLKQPSASAGWTSMLHCTWHHDSAAGQLFQVIDPQQQVWDYRYNAAGKLLAVSAPLEQGARSYSYDARQFLVSETTPETGTTTYERDAVGLVSAQTDARRLRVTYDRSDPLGRVKEIHYPTMPEDDVAFDYDGANNVISVSSGSGGSFIYAYDELNRVREQTWTRTRDGVTRSYTTGYQFDAAGCLNELTYPSGLVLSIACDSANRVTRITADGQVVISGVTYHPSGQPALVEYGNGTITSYDYDDRYRTRSVTVPGVLGLEYGYDGADNVTSRNDTEAPGSAWSMTYDSSSRLRTIVAAGASEILFEYQYDVLGNRWKKQGLSTTTGYAYDAHNRLERSAGNEATHSIKLTWDDAGRLRTSSDGATYSYDGHGRRVEKTDAGGATVYHYDAAGRVLAESRLDGSKLRDFVYLGGKLVAVSGCVGDEAPPCATWQWYHTDTLGSVSARTDAEGALVARLQYEPWGEARNFEGEPGDRQYNGRVYDPGTGFHDYGARMYWPQIGRFISADSYQGRIEEPASLNRYSYVFNNPYKFVDPTGHIPRWHGDSPGGVPEGVPWVGAYGPPMVLNVAGNPGNLWALAVKNEGQALSGASGGAGQAAQRGAVSPLARANYAQRTYSETFSDEGSFAGQKISDVVARIKSGQLGVKDIEIQYIERDGHTLILNTRSAQALTRAGVPREDWNAINMTGNKAAEARLTGQLTRNKLTSAGTPDAKSTGP